MHTITAGRIRAATNAPISLIATAAQRIRQRFREAMKELKAAGRAVRLEQARRRVAGVQGKGSKLRPDHPALLWLAEAQRLHNRIRALVAVGDEGAKRREATSSNRLMRALNKVQRAERRAASRRRPRAWARA